MLRAEPILLVLLAIGTGCARSGADRAPAGNTRPNVLFIAVDDFRPTLGVFGDPDIKSPNIDRLARTGAVFLEAHAQQAVCNPSRASLMTGLRPDTIKVWDLPDGLPHDHTGRRHPPAIFQAARLLRREHRQGLPQPAAGPSVVERARDARGRVPDGSRCRVSPSRQPADPGTAQSRDPQVRAPAQYIDQYGLWYLKANATESVDLPDSVYYDGAQTDLAVAKLAALKARGAPFFFSVGYSPAPPVQCAEEILGSLRARQDPVGVERVSADRRADHGDEHDARVEGYADFEHAAHPFEGSLTEADARRLKHGYDASVSYVDAQIGRLLDQLDALDLASSTIVVLWGDHGYKLGEHNGWAKMTNYQIDTHAPLIIRAPGTIPPGTRVGRLVEFVDVYPTLAELAGPSRARPPRRRQRVPLLKNPSRPWKTAIFSQFLRDGIWAAPDGKPYMGYSLLTESYHYVVWIDWNTKIEVARELYDRRADPDENTNLTRRAELADVQESLERQRAAGWRGALPGRN